VVIRRIRPIRVLYRTAEDWDRFRGRAGRCPGWRWRHHGQRPALPRRSFQRGLQILRRL